jgi:MSHA biogenesis protein MshJ
VPVGREQWRALGVRIDAMSLRERLFVFAAAVVVVFALVQTLLIDAGQRRVLNADTRLQSARSALEQIEQQQQLLAGQAGRNPDRTAQATLAAQETRLAGLNAELETRGHSLVPPERMAQVLKDVVRGQPGIRIDSFRTLSPHPVSLPGALEGSPAAFYRHGFEITVSGSYSALVAYLERLEALPWHLSWVETTLDATDRPDLKLTLTVHTLSLEEAWLRV